MTPYFVAIIAFLLVIGFAVGGETGASALATALTPLPTPQPATPVKASSSSTTGVYYASDGSLTGSVITNDPSTYPGPTLTRPNGFLWNICTAIALAEGFNQGLGTAPYDLNNPGDLSPGDEDGQPTAAPAQYHGGSNIIVFLTVENGFIALYDKFSNIVNGLSNVYSPSDTWAVVASKYAGNSSAWLANVTGYLGVDPSSTPQDYAEQTA